MLIQNHSSIRKIEIKIRRIDLNNIQLLLDKKCEIIEDIVKIKRTRHYKFVEEDSGFQFDFFKIRRKLFKYRNLFLVNGNSSSI